MKELMCMLLTAVLLYAGCLSVKDTAASAGTIYVQTLPADDTGLTLLVDYCKKTAATVGGDGYSELVLYRNDEDGTYQLHTYAWCEGMQAETHHAYYVPAETADRVFALIDALGLEKYENARGTGCEGAEYVVRFLKDGRLIRISTDNMDGNGSGILSRVGKQLEDVISAR